jgi:hypothetical protein
MRDFINSCLFSGMVIGCLLVPAGIIFMLGWWAGLPIMFVIGAAIFGSLGFWFLYFQLKAKIENKLLRVEQYPLLGEVKFYKSRWEASFQMSDRARITVDSDTPDIRAVHVSTFEKVIQMLPQVVSEAIDECQSIMKDMESRTPDKSEFVLSSIMLFGSNEGDFTIFFDCPEDSAPWGMSADFDAYKLACAEWNH